MYHQTDSSHNTRSNIPPSTKQNTHANAITPSTWFVNLFFEPLEDTF